jgi:hypothetical protein
MNESDRILYNKNKLQELYPYFRVRIEAVIKEMEQAGYRPRIQTAWRSPADQLDAYRNGASKVQYGFHNVTSPAGVKESLAADIWDDDRLEKVKVDFMLHLASAAEAQGLTTGIRWDLADEDSVLIDIALQNKNWDAKVRVGWDPLHVEPTGITLQEAKDGRRPSSSPTDPPVEPEPPAESSRPKKHFRVQDVDTNETVEYDNWTTAFKPVTLLPVPYVTQLGMGADTHKNDCGAACAIMFLRAYTDTTMTPDQFYTNFNIQGDPYLSVPTMRDAMGKLGVMTSFKAGLTMADLFNTFATGKPAIVLIRYKTLEDAGLTEKHYEGPHFAVAVGMDTKYVYLHDPLYTNVSDGEAHPYPLDIFWKSWKDVATDSKFPNPERSAIIPAVGLGYRMERLVVVTIPALNVRVGPGLGNKIVGTVRKGQVLNVIREVNGWGEIDVDRWIYLSYTLPAV